MHLPGLDSLRSAVGTVFVLGTVTACATASTSAGPVEYSVDERVPIAADGVMPVSLKAGPVTFTELRVRNLPDEDEVLNSSRWEHSRPKPTVRATGDGSVATKLDLEASLESEQGEVFLKCTRRTSLNSSGREEWNLCTLEAMYTRDWPRTKFFHLRASVKPRD